MEEEVFITAKEITSPVVLDFDIVGGVLMADEPSCNLPGNAEEPTVAHLHLAPRGRTFTAPVSCISITLRWDTLR